MPALKSRLAIITILSFLCVLVFTVPVSAQSKSGGMVDLKGTDSAGSFSYEEDQGQPISSIGHGVKHRRSEGSKSKSSSHGSKGHTHHISGSKSDKAHSPHGKSKPGYSHKKSEGSKSKSYSHSPHGKSKHSYGHKKSEGSQSKSYAHGKSGHGKSHRAYKGGHGRSHRGHGKSPFQHVLSYKKKLGLTDAQIQTMKGLEFEFKKKRIQAKADHQIAHMELELHVHSGKVDESKIRAAGAKIVAAKSNKIMAMIEAKIQLLNLLTEEQRQKMAKMH